MNSQDFPTINREHFEAWLFAQPRERVWEYANNTECVICSFLKETTKAKNVKALPDQYQVDNQIWLKLPLWLNDPGSINTDLLGYELLPTAAILQDRYSSLFGNPLLPSNAPALSENNQPAMTRPLHSDAKTQ